jgi:polyhydroxyalkanoic acid synthase PhaR subunit
MSDNKILQINPYKIWEEMYFRFESSAAKIFSEMVETKSFANNIDMILNNHLQFLKIQNEMISQYVKNTPLASKQDISRVAKLVTSVENKFDHLDEDFMNEIEDIKQADAKILEQLKQSDNSLPANQMLADLCERVEKVEAVLNRLETMLTAGPEKV